MPATGTDLIVNRADLAETRLVPAHFPDPLPEGTCLLKIDRYAMTANNITYAVAPRQMGYWNFFPSDVDGFGRVPVWGFADVVASAHPQVAVGTRVYGYLPMSTHLLVTPGKVGAQGFSDIAAHRAPMSPIYNHYALTSADPAWAPEREGLISLFRPLFLTSFLIANMLRASGFSSARQLILSSASSKTAIGLAHLAHADPDNKVEVIGLTSAANRAFVEGLGCYDRVLDYAAAADLAVAPAVSVDMAGNAGLRRVLHERYGDAMRASWQVGITHWSASGQPPADLPGAPPTLFFAPAEAQARIAEWGQDGFRDRAGAAWRDFIGKAQDWIEVSETPGPEAAVEGYLAALNDNADPARGRILSL